MPSSRTLEKLRDLRSRKGSTLVKVLIIVFVVTAFIANSSGGSNSSDASTADNSLFPAPVATDTPSGLEEEDNNDPVVKLPPKLKVRTRKFLEAYSLVNAGDTAAVRRKRIAPYVSPSYLKKIDLSVNLSGGQFVRGTVVVNQMTGVKGPKARTYFVTVPVIWVQKNRSSGQVLTESTQTILPTIVWSSKRTRNNPHGRWLVQNTG